MDSIKIGHHDYNVEKVENLEWYEESMNGLCHPDKKLIEISTKLTNQSSRNEILIHEATHGIFHESSVEDDEEMVTRISKTLHGFIKDNIDLLNDMYGR